ncbi:MAG: LytR C-terminal domain-containing protein [Nocardioides sp.]
MDARVKSLLTLIGLGGLLLVAALWGWSAVSEPFPEREGPGICVDRAYAEGDPIRRGNVTVSVLNAGTRNGLAALTLDLFVDAGFAEGQSGNVPDGSPRVRNVEIWTTDPEDAAVRLVAAQLGDAVRVVRREPTTAGVQVVVGDRFQRLSKGPRRIVADRDVEVCGPPPVA